MALSRAGEVGQSIRCLCAAYTAAVSGRAATAVLSGWDAVACCLIPACADVACGCILGGSFGGPINPTAGHSSDVCFPKKPLLLRRVTGTELQLARR